MLDWSGNIALHILLACVYVPAFALMVHRGGLARGLAPKSRPLLCFVGVYVLSVLFSNPNNIKRELTVILVLLMFLIILPSYFHRSLRSESVGRFLRGGQLLLMLAGSLASAFGVTAFLLNLRGSFVFQGLVLLYGMVKNRLWVASSPNVLAGLNLLAMWSALCWMLRNWDMKRRRALPYILLSLVLALNLAAFVLAQSRATILAFLTLVALLASLLPAAFGHLRPGLRRCARVLTAGLVAVFCYLIMMQTSALLHRLPAYLYSEFLPRSLGEQLLRRSPQTMPGAANRFFPPNEDFDGEPSGARDTFDSLFEGEGVEGHSWSARYILWDYGLNYVKESPVIGQGIATLRQKAIRDFPPNRLNSYLGGGFHSSYVSTLAYTGILGFCCMAAFLLYLLYKILCYALHQEGHYYEKMLMLLIPALLCRESLESVCLFGFYYEGLCFWLVVGASLYYLERDGFIDARPGLIPIRRPQDVPN